MLPMISLLQPLINQLHNSSIHLPTYPILTTTTKLTTVFLQQILSILIFMLRTRPIHCVNVIVTLNVIRTKRTIFTTLNEQIVIPKELSPERTTKRTISTLNEQSSPKELSPKRTEKRTISTLNEQRNELPDCLLIDKKPAA